MNVEFCDTNVLVYAHDDQSPRKSVIAQDLISRLWKDRTGALSIQVLQELYVALNRLLAGTADASGARRVVTDLTSWIVISPKPADFLAAIEISERWLISFWDAMILAAAKSAGASILWSEELSDGQDYEGVTVRNPFKSDGIEFSR